MANAPVLPPQDEPAIDKSRRWTDSWYPFVKRLLQTAKVAATSVETITEVIDGLSAKWGLRLNVNNRVVGIIDFAGTTSTSTFSILATNFYVYSSDDTVGNTAFTVGPVNGISTVGIRADQIIIDGTIQAYNIAANAITAAKIAAGSITTDKLNVTNATVLDGTFGTMKTNTGSTRVQITDTTNDMVVYSSGNVVVRAGATNASGSLEVYSTNSALYPAYGQNTSTTGGDLSTGGGAAYFQSVGGYALQAVTTTTANAAAINAANTGTGGGQGQIGRSTGLGGKAFYSLSGGYGPFTGSHDALIARDVFPVPGDIMIDGPVMARKISDCMAVCVMPNAPNQRGAIGVFETRYTPSLAEPPAAFTIDGRIPTPDWEDVVPVWDVAVVNALGEGAINVCGENGDIALGDFIVTSSTPGKGMRQDDDIKRSHTVARAREAVTFSSPTEVKQIACIYECG